MDLASMEEEGQEEAMIERGENVATTLSLSKNCASPAPIDLRSVIRESKARIGANRHE